ncbi:hypothetical protein DXM27_06175 [Rhizobium rhizogenes]|uniref:DUF1311 domain-containing protein n=1 Tax=Rhizobium rhizogenes TaxID=359 RepID=A0AA88F614_RHIRH|nr:hypothetical protein DXM27_06175 [Rhizobium rhizogenes]
MRLFRAAVAMLTRFAGSAAANGCSDAVDAYNSATSEISGYLRRYVGCVENSQGADDCSSEFRRLRNAQSDFETAVSNYQMYDCR